MDVFRQTNYLALSQVLNQSQQQNSHLLITSFAGSGASYLLKSYCQKHPTITYLDKPDQPMTRFNIYDSDTSNFDPWFAGLNYYLQSCSLDQKLAILIPDSRIFRQKQFITSDAITHLYHRYHLGAYSINDLKIFLHEINPKLSASDIKTISQLSGGIAKISKYLAINWPYSPDDPQLRSILKATLDAIFFYNSSTLESLGLSAKGHFASQLLTDYLQNNHLSPCDIVLSDGLNFSENNQLNPNRLTFTEKNILSQLISNQGFLSKEQISDIKWGQGKYDKFSDQAIHKSIRRLNRKLQKHQIQTLPKTGFQLARHGH